jgi:hypothetical protein
MTSVHLHLSPAKRRLQSRCMLSAQMSGITSNLHFGTCIFLKRAGLGMSR